MSKCFLDMDGVIADFVTGACIAHGRPSPYTEPESLGIFDMEKLWSVTPAEFWFPINAGGFAFWSGLAKTPEADGIVSLVSEAFGVENVAILTSPSMDAGCVPGKRAWIAKYFPQFSNRILFGSAKEFLAGPDKFLVDDRDKNILDFEKHGGIGVTVPRPWNALHSASDRVVHELKVQLHRRLR